ncbi:PAS domain-containing sensor histidine kinase [Iningainema tapete]|uniref:histidine kinase n=1 Tax=Iningainema tapete BLCC-T55 TaxID=2748662 RepID=A0A8J7CH75_9CYAN|nr:ATP-binding protein [Iningainema tapete]MBD2777300.1 PAS domain-containing sensor histidine kinase [Iningainema tapete BLCC-T55]
MQQSEEFFQISLEMLCIADGDGYFQQLNPAWEETLGWSLSELKASPFIEFVHPDDRLDTLAEVQKMSVGADSISFTNRYRCKDGSYKWLLWKSKTVLNKNLIYAVARDISDLKQTQETLHQTAQTATKQAQQLEEIIRELKETQSQLIQTEKMSSLGQLVAGIAHEINNPVNFIHGNITHASEYTQDLLRLLQLYQQHHSTTVPEIEQEIEAIDLEFVSQDLPKLLNSMKMGTERIRQIVLSLRNFSRLDEAEMKAVDIHEGIDNTLLLLQQQLKAKPGHPEIQVIKEYGNLPLVECYAGQLNQVFMNLLTNAIDALKESLVIDHLSLNFQQSINDHPQIIIRTSVKNNDVIIRIADNGPGIKEEVQKHLFDPFFTTKPIGKGTGMGLSISYKIVVEKHQGKLYCISVPGQGSEFVVSIPLQQNIGT